MLQQTLAQMGEISVRIALRCYSFVHLDDMHVIPPHILLREIAQHDPRGFATAHRDDEFASSRHRLSSVICNKPGGFKGNRVSIVIDQNLHHAASLATASASFSSGLLQP